MDQLSPGELFLGISLKVLAPLGIQFLAYFALARVGFRLRTARAVGVAVVRILLGIPLFLLAIAVSMQQAPHIGVVLAISSSVAWSIVSLMDPKRSLKRSLFWVLSGTPVTLVVNELFWRFALGESILSTDTHWSFG